MMDMNLADYFQQFGVNATQDVNLGDLVQQAQGNINSGQLSKISGYPELTATGAPTRSALGTYWSVPTAQGMRYITPETYSGPSGNGASGSSFTDSITNSVQKPWTVQNGDDGYYYAKGSNPTQARYSGAGLGLGPEWGGSNAYYNVYDQAPEEAYQKLQKEDDSFMGFALSSLGEFMKGPGAVYGTGLAVSGLMNGGFGNLFSNLGGSGAGAGGGAGGTGGSMDWWDSFMDSVGENFGTGGGGSTFPGVPPVASGANDAIGNLIGNLDKGMSSADAIKAVEASIPGSTQSTLQFLVNNPSQLLSMGVSPQSLLKAVSGLGGTDGMKTLGGLLGAGLGALGSSQQASSLQGIADRARADRQPFLNASLGYLNNPDSYFAGPGKSAMDGVLRGLSAKVGNPIGSPTSMGIATEAGLHDWRNAVTGFGNLGLAGQDTRAQLESNAAGAEANIYNALGSGISQVTNPQPSVTDLIKMLNMGGLA